MFQTETSGRESDSEQGKRFPQEEGRPAVWTRGNSRTGVKGGLVGWSGSQKGQDEKTWSNAVRGRALRSHLSERAWGVTIFKSKI